MEKKQILKSIIDVISQTKNDEGWSDLALLGKPLNSAGINYKSFGYLKLRDLIEEFSDELELRKDETHKVPVVYVKIKSDQGRTVIKQVKPNLTSNRIPDSLQDWAYMGDYRQTIQELKKLALEERWYYKVQDPSFPYPILSSYLTHTFFKLSSEKNKILFSDKYASFNTGLVNNLYEPIYALFEKNKNQGRQEWYFQEFCVSGVGRCGKILASNFNPLPKKADYFQNLSDLIYDTKGLEPQLNWDHIILDNISRLPIDFLEENKPSGFLLMDPLQMNTLDRAKYYEDLANAVQSDAKKFRSIKFRFSEALDLSLRRIDWNYRTAIPMYYPRNNKISLLIPLCLVDDDVIDLALVVEKTNSGNYLGHTILPLPWAYSNARLITRPDSDWLVADRIENEIRVDSTEEV